MTRLPRETTWVEERIAARIHVCASVREVVAYCREGMTAEARSPAMRAERHKLMRGVLAAQARYRAEFAAVTGGGWGVGR